MAQNNTHNMAGITGVAMVSAAVGAAMAILLTPKSGQEVREKIAKKAHTAKDKAEDMVGHDTPTNMP